MILRGERHVRLAREDDAERITDLFIIASPRHVRTKTFWIWSNIKNPLSNSLSVITECDNKIIAHYSLMPLGLSKKGEKIVIGSLGQLVEKGEYAPIPQDTSIGEFHKKGDVESIDRIDLDREYKARDLIDILRARTFPPYKGAYFEENGQKVYMELKLYGEDEP